MYIDKLKSLIPPPPMPSHTGELELRNEVNQNLGIELPEDYYQIIETYGKGCFSSDSNHLILYNPYVYDPDFNLFVQIEKLRTRYKIFKEGSEDYTDGKKGFPFKFYPSKNGLIPWAICDDGAVFYWKPSSEGWTIIVYDHSYDFFEYNFTTTQFLLKLIYNQIKEIEEYLPRDIFKGGVEYYDEGN